MRKIAFFCILLMPLVLVGCFMLPEEVPGPPPPYIAQPASRTFHTVAVARGEIRLGANPVAIYMPSRVEIQRFMTNGLPVGGIYVTIGDEVSAGDILASLNVPGIQNELDELISRRARLSLELELLNQRQELARRLGGEAAGEASFSAMARNLRDEINFIEDLMVYVEGLNENRYLRATMDGIVTSVSVLTPDLLTNSRLPIAIISDMALTSFVVRDPMAELMHPGDRFEMTLEDEIFLMEVVDLDELGFIRPEGQPEEDNAETEAFLAFVDEPPRQLRTGMRGIVHMLFEDAAPDALYIPISALRRYEERSFVYVLEGGIRTVRDVTTGVENEDFVEIVSGLAEGELVIQ